MIDTPGLNDPEPGRDSLNIAEMVEELKKLKDVNVFLIAFNGSDPRFNNSLIAMIKIFQNMFGREFLEKNTVFEFTNWSHDKASVRRRGTSKTEAYWAGELNKQLKELFAVPASVTVPAVFIDSLWDKEEPAENAKFEEEMGKLWAYLNSFPAYACEGFEAVKVELDELKDNIDSLQREKDEAEAARREMEKLNVEEVGSAGTTTALVPSTGSGGRVTRVDESVTQVGLAAKIPTPLGPVDIDFSYSTAKRSSERRE